MLHNITHWKCSQFTVVFYRHFKNTTQVLCKSMMIYDGNLATMTKGCNKCDKEEGISTRLILSANIICRYCQILMVICADILHFMMMDKLEMWDRLLWASWWQAWGRALTLYWTHLVDDPSALDNALCANNNQVHFLQHISVKSDKQGAK